MDNIITTQEAIRTLKMEMLGDSEQMKCAKQTAIEALEKQIAKKPDSEGDGYDDNGKLIYDTWICPCCQIKYELDYDDYKFCPECGQKIDWSEQND